MGFQRIGEVVKKLLAKMDLEERSIEAFIREWWRDVVGSEVAPYTKVASLKKRRLVVLVESPVLVQELTQYRRKQIQDELNRRIGNLYIKDIFFKVGEVRSGEEGEERKAC